MYRLRSLCVLGDNGVGGGPLVTFLCLEYRIWSSNPVVAGCGKFILEIVGISGKKCVSGIL